MFPRIPIIKPFLPSKKNPHNQVKSVIYGVNRLLHKLNFTAINLPANYFLVSFTSCCITFLAATISTLHIKLPVHFKLTLYDFFSVHLSRSNSQSRENLDFPEDEVVDEGLEGGIEGHGPSASTGIFKIMSVQYTLTKCTE